MYALGGFEGTMGNTYLKSVERCEFWLFVETQIYVGLLWRSLRRLVQITEEVCALDVQPVDRIVQYTYLICVLEDLQLPLSQ